MQIAPRDQNKTTFVFPCKKIAYQFIPFGLCNAPKAFQVVVLNIFEDLIQDIIEGFMDDFTTYGDTFDEALTKLEKILK